MTTPQRVDLHLHTRCSDGAHTPEEVVQRAAGNLSTISICDHDTLSAYTQLSIPDNLRLLPGIEMTCQVGESDLHMLAYFPDGLRAETFSWALRLEEDRRERVTEGVTRLRESGIPLRWEDLEAETMGGVPCRSHVARALVRGGLTNSAGSAYRQWLGKTSFRRPALVSSDAFDQVHSLGGLVFWAHPAGDDVIRYGETLLKSGLDGMETLSRNLSPESRDIAKNFQSTHQLGASGGSDLHIETAKRKIGQYGVDTNRIDPRLQV